MHVRALFHLFRGERSQEPCALWRAAEWVRHRRSDRTIGAAALRRSHLIPVASIDGHHSDIPSAGKFETMRYCARPHCFRPHARVQPVSRCFYSLHPAPGLHHAPRTSARARKPMHLLQFRRPSLRNAVTASLLSLIKIAAAETSCADVSQVPVDHEIMHVAPHRPRTRPSKTPSRPPRAVSMLREAAAERRESIRCLCIGWPRMTTVPARMSPRRRVVTA